MTASYVILSRRSIHSISNVPSEPERAAEARRAVVASKIHSNICHFWVFWGEFRDSRIQTSGFESRTHESTSKIFESLESNGKLTRSREQHHWDSLALAFSSVSMIFSRIFSINLSTILRGEVLWFSTDTLALIYIKFTKNRHYGVDVMALKSFPYFNKSF